MSNAGTTEERSPERWSAQAKSEVVLRLLRGEGVDTVSREIQVPAHQIETWRLDFLEAAVAGLKKRAGDVEARALKQRDGPAFEIGWGTWVLIFAAIFVVMVIFGLI